MLEISTKNYLILMPVLFNQFVKQQAFANDVSGSVLLILAGTCVDKPFLPNMLSQGCEVLELFLYRMTNGTRK